MKLVTYDQNGHAALGVVWEDAIVDIGGSLEFPGEVRAATAELEAAARIARQAGRPPADMVELLARGEEYRAALGTLTKARFDAWTKSRGSGDLVTPLASARLLAPIPRPGKITCVGLNYADHAREQGLDPPSAPIFFLKSNNTICGPDASVQLPPNSTQVDYEAELAVVIGKGGGNISEDRVWEHIAGYTILNDVSARDLQFSDKQWFRGKSCDTFAPTGPWIVTREEIPDPHQLKISLTLNGETMQDSTTSNLIFKVPFLVSYLSQSLTWEPGDLLSTGTPPGVGVFRKPPVFLRPNDRVSIRIDGLGTLTNTVAGHASRA